MSPAVAKPRSALPAAYAAFTPVFERLSEPLRRIVQGHLLQFEQLLRVLDPPDLAERGEFEGLGGLTQRGDIANLVQSELLLRTEAPLEFLRRLAESETLYHEKIYADPGARQAYQVIISGGPGLLGHGRILALAALFFLARVAESRKASFSWCILPREGGAVWSDEITVSSLKRLLRSASFREATEDDVIDACALWDEANPAQPGKVAVTAWVIGAKARWSIEGRGPRAVEALPNSLSFILRPPGDGDRSADIFLRERGFERTQAEIRFPADGVCVSALNQPFSPIAPPKAPPPAAGEPMPVMTGWAPDYFIHAGGDTKIVRFRKGLLLLRLDSAMGVIGRWFLPLGEKVKLAGVRFYQTGLSVVVQDGGSTPDRIVYGFFELAPGSAPRMRLKRSEPFPSEHLFRKQSPHALPSLSVEGGSQFYSSTGMLLHFMFSGGEGTPSTIKPIYGAPKIIFSNGRYNAVEPAGDASIIQVTKAGTARSDAFDLPGPADWKTLRGMVYNASEQALAYSVARNLWTIPPLRGLPTARPALSAGHMDDWLMPVEAWETLVAGRARPEGLTARVWSHARYGGDGTVRTHHRSVTGKRSRGSSVITLGEHAMDIVKVEIADDGLHWALSVDKAGEPHRLTVYRPLEGRTKSTELRLDELLSGAPVLDLELADG